MYNAAYSISSGVSALQAIQVIENADIDAMARKQKQRAKKENTSKKKLNSVRWYIGEPTK